jgi:hypothetical protein
MLMASLLNDSRQSQRPRFAVAPHKTDPPLIVNANAALTLAVAVQSLQTIAGRHSLIVELLRRVDRQQLRAGATLNLRGRSRMA